VEREEGCYSRCGRGGVSGGHTFQHAGEGGSGQSSSRLPSYFRKIHQALYGFSSKRRAEIFWAAVNVVARWGQNGFGGGFWKSPPHVLEQAVARDMRALQKVSECGKKTGEQSW